MKSINKKIQVERIVNSFQQINWNARVGSETGSYWIFTPSVGDTNAWAVLPVELNTSDYLYHQDRVIKVFLTIFDLPFTDESYQRIHGYLSKEHYEIKNRVELKNQNATSVPYDLFKNLIEKNVLSLRTYCLHRDFNLPFDKLSVNHTREGSFIVPLSVEVTREVTPEGTQNSFIQPRESEIIKEYLKMLNKICISPKTQANEFAKYMVENDIDSKIVKNFLNDSNSLSWARFQYERQISELTISSEENPFLDYNLSQEFPLVDLSEIVPVEKGHIEALERMEAEADDNNISCKNAKLKVIIDEIARNWVKVTVLTIDGNKPGNTGKYFKAKLNVSTSDLPQYDEFAKAMPEAEPVTIFGEVEKLKGRTGEIILKSGDIEIERQEKMF